MHEGEDLTVRWMTFGVKELLLSFFPERGKFVSSASKNGYCTTLPSTCPSFPNVSSADKSIVASNVFSPIVSETFLDEHFQLVDNSAFLKTCSSSIVVLLFITKIYMKRRYLLDILNNTKLTNERTKVIITNKNNAHSYINV